MRLLAIILLLGSGIASAADDSNRALVEEKCTIVRGDIKPEEDRFKVLIRCDNLDLLHYDGWWRDLHNAGDGSYRAFFDWCYDLGSSDAGIVGHSLEEYFCEIPPFSYWRMYARPVVMTFYFWVALLAMVGTALWKPVLFPAFVRWRQRRLEPQPAQVGAGGTNITIRQARPLSEWFRAAYWIGRLVLLAIPTLWILGHMDGALDLLTVFVPDDLRPAFARWLQGLAGKIEAPPQ